LAVPELLELQLVYARMVLDIQPCREHRGFCYVLQENMLLPDLQLVAFRAQQVLQVFLLPHRLQIVYLAPSASLPSPDQFVVLVLQEQEMESFLPPLLRVHVGRALQANSLMPVVLDANRVLRAKSVHLPVPVCVRRVHLANGLVLVNPRVIIVIPDLVLFLQQLHLVLVDFVCKANTRLGLARLV